MKTKKNKNISTKAKKQIKNDIEISLTNKLSDFVRGLGHDASEIASELKKASKLLAKKLSKKVSSVTAISKLKKDKIGNEAKKVIKKETPKPPKKVKKVIEKAIKKSGEKAANIEDIVKKEIINPAKVVLDSKPEEELTIAKANVTKKVDMKSVPAKSSKPKANTKDVKEPISKVSGEKSQTIASSVTNKPTEAKNTVSKKNTGTTPVVKKPSVRKPVIKKDNQ